MLNRNIEWEKYFKAGKIRVSNTKKKNLRSKDGEEPRWIKCSWSSMTFWEMMIISINPNSYGMCIWNVGHRLRYGYLTIYSHSVPFPLFRPTTLWIHPLLGPLRLFHTHCFCWNDLLSASSKNLNLPPTSLSFHSASALAASLMVNPETSDPLSKPATEASIEQSVCPFLPREKKHYTCINSERAFYSKKISIFT